MENIILREWLEIRGSINVLTWDKVSLLYKKNVNQEIGEMVLTLEAIKLLLVDKSKVSEIDDILEGNLNDETIALLNDWGTKVQTIIESFIEGKKK